MADLSLVGLLIVVGVVGAALLGVIALVDAIRRPAWQWSQADRSKAVWITALLIGILAGIGGLFAGLAYFLFAQPALKRARPPIGPPGGTYRSSTAF